MEMGSRCSVTFRTRRPTSTVVSIHCSVVYDRVEGRQRLDAPVESLTCAKALRHGTPRGGTAHQWEPTRSATVASSESCCARRDGRLGVPNNVTAVPIGREGAQWSQRLPEQSLIFDTTSVKGLSALPRGWPQICSCNPFASSLLGRARIPHSADKVGSSHVQREVSIRVGVDGRFSCMPCKSVCSCGCLCSHQGTFPAGLAASVEMGSGSGTLQVARLRHSRATSECPWRGRRWDAPGRSAR